MSKKAYLAAAVGLLATAVACSDKSPSPAAPTSAPVAADDTNAAADGSTLKVPAPVQTAPANGAALDQFETTVKVNVVTAKFVNTTQFAYRFQLLLNGQVVRDFRTSSSTEWRVTDLDVNVTYGWRARAEQGQSFGPWSATWTFKTPDVPEGYIAGGEVYDPLWTGTTVGTISGAVEFIADTGAKMVGHGSHIEYALGATVDDGEFSMMVTNTPANTEGNKTKIMSMREGRTDITTNDRRFTIEKRGDPPGIVAWRVITSNDQVDTVGAERISVNFLGNKWYLWTARWGGGRFNLTIREDGASGKVVYNFGKSYRGTYDPNPQLAYVGAPIGRGGARDATIPGMIAKQVWLSSRDRPDFANK
ncbi:MAG: hypothetical protein JJE40_14950 [Vicinamibacteria bacterium]|nr:hypothetical protein [Vicinamibacteria bacterium]